MTHKERALAAIGHKRTDRPPLDYFADKRVTERLLARLGLRDKDELLRYFDTDVRWIEPFFANGQGRIAEDGKPESCFGFRTVAHDKPDGSIFVEFLDPPLGKMETLKEILDHNWPGEGSVFRHDYGEQLERYKDYATLTGPWCPIFNYSQHLRGTEQLFIDMAQSPEIVKAIAGKIADFFMLQAETQFTAMGGKCDIFFTGDDFSSQRGPLMSLHMFREFYFDLYKRLFGLAHDFGLKTMLHSCGAVSKLIPMFIEAGVDIIDPVQVRADGMDIGALKDRFGGVLSFHGAIDQQKLLPFGEADEVRAAVRLTASTLGEGGGYILCSSHEFQVDTPLDNILAMYDEAGSL